MNNWIRMHWICVGGAAVNGVLFSALGKIEWAMFSLVIGVFNWYMAGMWEERLKKEKG